MGKRFVAIWFRFLQTDWLVRRHPHLHDRPLVVKAPDHGRMVIVAANEHARIHGIETGMVLADARAVVPDLATMDDEPGLIPRLLTNLANWTIYYSPIVAVDLPDGLILDATGCAHLWGGEDAYIKHIHERFTARGYQVQIAMADTVGAAWAFSRFGNGNTGIEKNHHHYEIQSLPAASLRLDSTTIAQLQKLGLRQIKDFIKMPRTALRRRFGPLLLQRIDQALGHIEEPVIAVQPPPVYQERLPCLELIITATGIRIALERLLALLCCRLQQEQKGLREVVFTCYRADHQMVQVQVETSRPGYNTAHLLKLFEDKITAVAPGPGIELFTIEARKIEPAVAGNISIWENTCTLQSQAVSELIDRLKMRLGANAIRLYTPAEEYLPERSCKISSLPDVEPAAEWMLHRPRPLHLLPQPQPVEVMAPVPDYPPMLFRYGNKRHKIIKADGPERIEQQWWLQRGEHRDYYYVEDEDGNRYWLFRSGHYTSNKTHQWFLHGFFV